jgi:hypothetical protein
MKGAITGKDVVRQSVSIIRLWGIATYLSCLWAAITGRPRTFLGVLYPPPRPARALRKLGLPPRAGAAVLAAGLSRGTPRSLASERLPSGGGR